MDNNKIKTLLLTGPRGNIGSAVTSWMNKNHPEVKIVNCYYPFSIQVLHDMLIGSNADYFLNCAGLSEDKPSINDSYAYFDTNSTGVLKQLEVIKKYSPNTKYCTLGSIYEHDPQRNSIYVNSKRVSRIYVNSYHINYNIFAFQPCLGLTEYYNRKEGFLSKKIIKEIFRIYNHYKDTGIILESNLKNIDEKFYWTWAEDVVESLWNIFTIETIPPYNCYLDNSCNFFSIKEFIDIGLNHLGIPKTFRKAMTSSFFKTPFEEIVKNLIDYELNANKGENI